MNQAQALYQLQTVDLAIAEHQHRLAQIEAQLGANEHVVAAERALQAADQALTPWRSRARDLDLEIKSVSEKMTSVEKRLYSGAVSNPKELQDMQQEVASLKRRRATLEDHLLEAMIEVEEGEAAYEQAIRHLEQVQADWASDQQDLVTEQQNLQHALVGLEAQREAALQAVSAESLAEYDSLRVRRRGQAVAELDDATCKACGVSQTSSIVQQARQSRSLVYCANCGRILVLP